MALPAALLRGDNKSSLAKDGPITTSLIFKSPECIAGILPETSTFILRALGEPPTNAKFSGVPVESCSVYVKSSVMTDLFKPALFEKVTTPVAAANVPVIAIVLLSMVKKLAVTALLTGLILKLNEPL